MKKSDQKKFRNHKVELIKEVPEDLDLGVRIGTDDQVVWEAVVKDTQVQLENLKKATMINTEILKMAEKKVEEEKLKV